MHRIHPISEDTIKLHLGLPVCAILHDGTEHYGVISKIEGGKLILNDFPQEAGPTLKRKKAKEAKRSNASQSAQIKGLGFGLGYPYGYGTPFGFGRRIVLDIALIALLFALIW